MTSSISRRNFLKGSVATAAVASLAACGGSDGGDATDGSKKKIVRWGQGNPKLGLDMQKSTNSGSSNVSDPIFESLLRWTEENELVPCLLAEVPTFEADGVTLHCALKENVKFHDGTTLTANGLRVPAASR